MAKNITEIIREICERSMPNVVTGVVTETEPLRIMLVDDMSILLSAQSLIVSSEMLPLKKGEELYLLATNRNKIYYVLNRV
ncbi:MAG: hypothetical protein Q4C77_02910 [Eubacteriales bacterium]|nr:hypothetical protein [Eubacteriales bacterium]